MEGNICNKVYFSSKKFAEEDIARIKSKSNRDKKPIRAYLCKNCNSWHLTSSPPKGFVGLTQQVKELEEERDILIKKLGAVNKERDSLIEKNKEKSLQIENIKKYADNLKISMESKNKKHIDKLESRLLDYKNRIELLRTKESITDNFFAILSSQSNSKEVLVGIKDYVEKKLKDL